MLDMYKLCIHNYVYKYIYIYIYVYMSDAPWRNTQVPTRTVSNQRKKGVGNGQDPDTPEESRRVEQTGWQSHGRESRATNEV